MSSLLSHTRRGLGLAVMCLLARLAAAGPGDQVYMQTRHGHPVTGVLRDSTLPVGSCLQCHSTNGRFDPTNALGLFQANDNALCFTCHVSAGASGVYQGEAAYLASDHGLCSNCHTPHGAADAQGLIPSQVILREEALCLACHDSSGPAMHDIASIVASGPGHPVQSIAGRHAVTEGLTPSAFGAGNRHAECVDCHNPHAARSADVLDRVSRISVSNGAAGTTPTYVPRLAGDGSPAQEYEVCFKCHSSWTTLPSGARDLALELNPANASFHPVEAAGKNLSSWMAASLAGGLGVPHLTTSSRITCSDCHGSQALPTSVTTLSSYVGPVPVGPHGDGDAPTPSFSSAVLRARYRTAIDPPSYDRNNFELCFICHSPQPFEISGPNISRFGSHRRHVRGERMVCSECHHSIHGSAGAYYPSNRQYARLVSFAPHVQGPGGSGAPSFVPKPTAGGRGYCYLRCHGEDHDPETY